MKKQELTLYSTLTLGLVLSSTTSNDQCLRSLLTEGSSKRRPINRLASITKHLHLYTCNQS